jgi:hypothetical protein
VRSKNIRTTAYAVDTMKHLLMLKTGMAPGFRPAGDSEILLPVSTIEQAYTKVYGLNHYAAMVMVPGVLGVNNDYDPVYYSMAYPTLLEGFTAAGKKNNIMEELRNVKTLMITLEEMLKTNDARIFETIKSSRETYFHSDKDQLGEIIDSQAIARDKNIAAILEQKFKRKKFPSYGQFFRGCIRISSKDYL